MAAQAEEDLPDFDEEAAVAQAKRPSCPPGLHLLGAMAAQAEEDLPDFDEEAAEEPKETKDEGKDGGEAKKGNFTAIHASGFRDFLLKPELLRALLTVASNILRKCNMSASPKLSWAQMFCARRNPEWGRPQCSFWHASNNWMLLRRPSKLW